MSGPRRLRFPRFRFVLSFSLAAFSLARRFTLDGALLGTTVVETGRLRGAQHAATSAAQAPAQMLTSSPRSMRSRIAANSVSARG